MKIEAFTESDLPLVRELQPEDWGDIYPAFDFFVRAPYCSPLKMVNAGRTIGIGAGIFHEDSAWLAAIIVRPEERSKGIGMQITKTLIDHIDRKKFTTISLDATNFGYPIYQKLGFEVETEYAHFRGSLQTIEKDKHIIPFEDAYLDELLELDHLVSAEQRRVLLMEEIKNTYLYIADNKIEGAYFFSLKEGMVIAKTIQAGQALMQYRMGDRDIAALPVDNKAGMDVLMKRGFTQIRTSRRMWLGEKREWKPAFIYNRISGQLG